MFRALRENLLDEFTSLVLLKNIFRFRSHPPRRLDQELIPEVFWTGQRQRIFETLPDQFPVEQSKEVIQVNDSLCRMDFEFASDVPSGCAENDRVRCSRWSHPDYRNSRVIIGVDGIVQLRDSWFRTLAETLVPAGWDVIMMDAPYNFRRTPPGYRPGQLILGGDVHHLLHVGIQSLRDLKRLVEATQSRGETVGLVGISYGGWMTTNIAQLVPNLTFLHAVTPPLEMSWMLREGGAIVRAAWKGLAEQDWEWDELQEVMKPLSPYHYPLQIPGDRVWFHTANYDRFVSTARIKEYAERTGSNLRRWPRGHISLTCRTDVARVIGQQLIDDRSPEIAR